MEVEENIYKEKSRNIQRNLKINTQLNLIKKGTRTLG